jgi:stage II sporulation protein D
MKNFFCILLFVIMINTVAFASSELPEYIRVKLKDGSIIEVELETYLYSVVQSEMGISYKSTDMTESEPVPLEALKAQAVASRSYAISKINSLGEDAEYHVQSTTTSQVYNENANINKNVKKAVDETAGQVMTYDDEIICAYFFSTSGGYTEAPENVWPSSVPYLKAVKDEYEIEVDNCTTWKAVYTMAEISSKIGNIGKVEDVKILERSENDRVTKLKIIGDKGTKILEKDKIRAVLGATKLRSQWFDVEIDGDDVIFTGRGNGHGVGMSQNGAIGMALKGFDYEEILEWYYTDIEILGSKSNNSSNSNDDNKYPEQHIEIDEEETKSKPLLEKLVNVLSTNWLENSIMKKDSE